MTASIQNLLISFLSFINGILIPFLIALAFLFFLWNIFRYFILESASEEGRKKAKQYALYSIAAFVLIVIFWGIVNVIVEGLDIDRLDPITPDYILNA